MSVDPVVAVADLISFSLARNIYEPLVGWGTSTLPNGQTITNVSKFVPGLAKNWTESSDGKTWTFYLRSGVTFSNGDPFNAQTVAYTVNRTITMGNAGGFFLGLAGITMNGTKVINDSTIQFTVTPGPFLLQGLTYMLIVDPAFVQAHGGVTANTANPYMTDHAMGTGPFTLQSYDPSTGAVLLANKDYWGGAPKLNEVNIRVVPSDSTREELLDTNAVQMANNIPPQDVSSINGTSGVTVAVNPSPKITFMGMSWQSAPFNNTLVRQAIAYAIPYNQILQNVMYGYATQLRSVVPNSAFGYNGSYFSYSQNITKAKALLAQAGYPNGFSTTLTLSTGFSDEESDATIVQSALAQIGITVNIQTIDSSTFITALTGGKLQGMYITFLVPAINDIRYLAYGFFYSKGFANWDHINSTQVDQLATQAYYGPENQTAYNQFQQVMDQMVAWGYLYQWPDLMGLNSHAQGFRYCNLELELFDTMYVT